MTIRCITFDLDDTLWSVEAVMRNAERVFYAWLVQNYPRISEQLTPDALVTHRRAHAGRFPELSHDFTALRRRWLAHLAETFEYGPALVDEGFRVYWQSRNTVTLYDGVHELLESLRGRYALGAITNGNADVDYIGIGHYFDFVVTAAKAGAPKPEARIFRAALAEAGVAAERVLHVGDDASLDVLGASAVGMRTVWVNPRGEPWPGGTPPHAEIRSVTELDAVLTSLASSGARDGR